MIKEIQAEADEKAEKLKPAVKKLVPAQRCQESRPSHQETARFQSPETDPGRG